MTDSAHPAHSTNQETSAPVRALAAAGQFVAGLVLAIVVLVFVARIGTNAGLHGFAALVVPFLVLGPPSVALAVSPRRRPLGLGAVGGLVIAALAEVWFLAMFHV